MYFTILQFFALPFFTPESLYTFFLCECVSQKNSPNVYKTLVYSRNGKRMKNKKKITNERKLITK